MKRQKTDSIGSNDFNIKKASHVNSSGEAGGISESAPIDKTGRQIEPIYRFTIKDVIRTFGISRSTLIYYEDLGIVHPERNNGSGYRTYTESDIFRLMNASFLKGIGIAPKNFGDLLDEGTFTDEGFEEYLRMASRRIEYEIASRDCLQRLNHLRQRVGEIWTEEIEPYYICWDNAEQGYHNFPVSENLNLLMSHMPLGSLGSYGDDSYVGGENVELKWGRTVALRYAHLIPGLSTDMDLIGGCECVCFAHFEPHLYEMTRSQTFAKKDGDRIVAYEREHNLRKCGTTFWPFTLPSAEGFYVLTCIPVEHEK